MLNARPSPAVAGSYLVGSVSGALVSAAALWVISGLLSPIPPSGRAIIAVIAVGVLAAHTLGLMPLRLPQNARQIPREVFLAARTRSAFRFAFELGTGVRTYITNAAPYAAALTIALLLPDEGAQSALSTAAVALGFGIGRSLVVVGQLLWRPVIVEHPRWASGAAGWLALISTVGLAVTAVA